MKLPNDLIKYLIIEFVSGNISSSQELISPYAVLNFITLLARVYGSKKLIDVERKALPFVLKLEHIFSKMVEDNTIYDAHLAYIDTELCNG